MSEPVNESIWPESNTIEHADLPMSVFKAVFDHAADGFVVMTSTRHILYMNRAATELIGQDDVAGAHCGALLQCHTPDSPTLMFQNCFGQCVMANKEALSNVEMNIRTSTGVSIPVEVTYSYIPASSGESYLLMSIRNISDRKRMERERRQKEELRYTLQERERLARDLHDGVVQDIAYANMQTKLLVDEVTNGSTINKEELMKIRDILDDSYVELRQAIYDLTFQVKEDLETYIQRSLEEFAARSAIQVHFECKGCSPETEPFVTTQIAKIIQEALTNIRKHAHASRIDVSLRPAENQSMLLKISDNGVGFAVNETRGPGHYGMGTMLERTALIGGRLSIHSSPGHGTSIQVLIPASVID